LNNKINLFFIGDAVQYTGFQKVSSSIFKYLPREDYDLRVLGVNYHGDPHPYSYPIYPAGIYNDVYGINRIKQIVHEWTPDIIFILNDAWIIRDYLEEIKTIYKDKAMPKIVLYVPVDAEDHLKDWYKDFVFASKVVAYTQFGKKVIEKAAPDLLVDVISHGVDNQDFFKIEGPSRREIKAALFPDREDYLDSFIVLNAGRNQPRKKIDITIKGFAEFAKDKPENVKLYLHMGFIDSGHINVFEIADRYNLGERLALTTTDKGPQTSSVDVLNLIYNATDVGINTGVGEGFSLPNIEHAVTGAPQVVADHSALHELYLDCGLLIPARIPLTQDKIMTTGYLVTVEDVANKLNEIYTNKILYRTLADKCYKKFTSPEFSWENISKQWDSLFKELM
jgi:D-inositol-3-phosphate glycosyltransferase